MSIDPSSFQHPVHSWTLPAGRVTLFREDPSFRCVLHKIDGLACELILSNPPPIEKNDATVQEYCSMRTPDFFLNGAEPYWVALRIITPDEERRKQRYRELGFHNETALVLSQRLQETLPGGCYRSIYVCYADYEFPQLADGSSRVARCIRLQVGRFDSLKNWLTRFLFVYDRSIIEHNAVHDHLIGLARKDRELQKAFKRNCTIKLYISLCLNLSDMRIG